MKPEEKAEIILYNWLRPQVEEIYINRKNKYLYAPIFKVKSKKDSKTPDLIIKTLKGHFIVVEIKPSYKFDIVSGGAEQLYNRYFKPYCEKEKEFIINGKIIKIHSFVLATNLSPESKLASDRELLRDGLKEGKPNEVWAIKNKINPRYEFTRTHDLVRGMWRQLREELLGKEINLKRFSGLGILISDYENKIPYIFVKYKTKNRYGIHYWRLS